MAVQTVVNRNEVLVGGTRFATRGNVRIANIAVTPNPIAYGDTSRQGDTQVMSQLIQVTATGGSGVYRGNPRTDVERYWTSTLETRYRNMFCLPPLSYDMGKPASLSTENLLLSREYQNLQYFVFAGGNLFRWNDASATFNDNGTVIGGWSALLATLAANPTDSEIFKDYLYFAYGNGTEKMVLSGGSEVVSAVAGDATYLKVWDEKLWKLYQVANVWTTASTILGGSATEVYTVGGILPSGVVPTQLTTFRNVAGDEVLALLSNVGLWLYDASTAKWRQTEVRIPPMPFGQRSVGDIFRDGKLYFTTGAMGVVAVQPGNPFIITPVGLDRDDGLPATEAGKTVALISDFNWVLALVDGTVVTAEDEMYSGLGGPFDTPEWPVDAGVMTLRAYNGAWYTIWQSGADATPGSVLTVSGAYNKRRVYWGSTGKAYCQDLPSTVYNPRFNPTPKFAPGPVEHITSWYDFGSDVQQKIQGHFWMRTTGSTPDESIAVYYQLDLDESSWTLLDTLTTDGMHEIKPGGSLGVQCQLIRFRFVVQRGADASLTPRIEFWAADFLRVLPATYAFVVQLDLSKKHDGKTPAQMVKVLKDLSDPEITPGMIQFVYQDELHSEAQTYYGRISRLQGESEAGSPLRGQGWFQLSFMVPYLKDAE